MSKFEIEAALAQEWVDTQSLVYASAPHFVAGTVRLRYWVGSRVWVVEHDTHEVWRTNVVEQAVEEFNHLTSGSRR